MFLFIKVKEVLSLLIVTASGQTANQLGSRELLPKITKHNFGTILKQRNRSHVDDQITNKNIFIQMSRDAKKAEKR